MGLVGIEHPAERLRQSDEVFGRCLRSFENVGGFRRFRVFRVAVEHRECHPRVLEIGIVLGGELRRERHLPTLGIPLFGHRSEEAAEIEHRALEVCSQVLCLLLGVLAGESQ